MSDLSTAGAGARTRGSATIIPAASGGGTRNQTRNLPAGSHTQLEHRNDTHTSTQYGTVLRLRGANAAVVTASTSSSSNGPRVQWAEDVVDNEGLGRKSSKVCCIYHRPRAVDESSSDSDSSSSSSDSNSDSGRAGDIDRRGKAGNRSTGRDNQGHDHDDCGGGDGNVNCPHARSSCGKQGSMNKKTKRKRRPSPNAYEKIPRNNPPRPSGSGGGGGGGVAV